MKKTLKVAVLFLTAALLLGVVSCSVQETTNSIQPSTSQNSSAQSENSNIQNSERDVVLYPAQVSYPAEQKWGYISDTGKFKLSPTFSKAFRFQPNDLAVAGKGEKVGLIDKTGEFVVAPVYTNIGDFNNGLVVAQEDNGFVVLNSRGEVISQTHSYIGNYKSSNRAVYSVQTQTDTIRYGYLDETGKTVIEPAYEYAGEFEGDRAVAKLPNKGYVLIDETGKTLKNFDYSYVMNISDSMMAFNPEQGGRFGYLNAKGDVAIAPSFLLAENFKDGTAVVNASNDYTVNQYGLVDKKGNYLIKPQYNKILQLGDGMVALGVAIDTNNIFAGSKFALATLEGTILTDFKYYNIEPFKDGVTSAYDNTSTFFIDKTGRNVEDLPSVEGIGTLEQLDGLVYADIDQRPYYMNKQGNIVYLPSKSTILINGMKVSEEKFRPNRNYLVYYPQLVNLDSLKVEESVNTKLRDKWVDLSIKPTDNLDYHYEGSFNIGLNQKNLLVLEETGYDYPFGATHGMPVKQYVHVDTKTGAFYQLEELFKDRCDYVDILSGIVEEQIKLHGEEMGVWPDSYKGIRPDQPFCLTSDALMLYFTPYEIAPYAAGYPTFTIPYTEISNIINKKGSFWLSLN